MPWFFCEPNGEGWVLARQVSERELKGLLVPLAHALDAVFVHVLPCSWVSERLEERLKLILDEDSHILLLDPLCQWPLRVCIVIQSSQVIFWINSIVWIVWISTVLHHAQLLLS